MTPDSTIIDLIQRRALEDDWVSFNRHFFLQCAEVDQTTAVEIAGASLSYEIDRLFNIYARGLKRMRKQGHKTMVMTCDSTFTVLISHEVMAEIPEEGGYPFRPLEEIAEKTENPVCYAFLWARVVSSFVELLHRKKADEFAKTVCLGTDTPPILLPREARIFVRPEGDPFEVCAPVENR